MSFLKSFLKKSGLAYQQVEDETNLDRPSHSSPEDQASLLSKLSFWWAQPLVKLGASRTLRRDDLGSFPSYIHTEAVDTEFLKIYDHQVEKAKLRINSEAQLPEEQRKFLEKDEKRTGFVNNIKWLRNSPLFRAYILYGVRTFLWGGLLKFVAAVGQVVSPLLLKLLLEHLGAVGTIDKQPIHYGYFFALALFLSAFTQAYALQCLYWVGFKFGSCYREASMSLVYRKLLRLSAASKRQATTGQMMNLVSVDAMRLMDFTWNPHDWWASPIIIVANMCVLFYMVGYPAIVGGLMLLALGKMAGKIKLSLRYQEEIIGVSDDRISKITEMLTNIKFLKLYSWENIFRSRATNVRESELSLLKKIAYLRALSSFLWTISPAIVSLLTFTLFTIAGGILTPSLAFTILAVNNSIREPIGKFFQCMNEMLKAWISTKRIGDFLSLDELDEPVQVENKEYAVQIDGDFTWDTEPTMEELSLKIPHGKLYIIVGPVGSGKTSLISAILGDIKRTKGDVLLSGQTVATSQSAWLMNASLRENILFGEPFNQEKYDKVIDRCALRRDIDGFTGGDQTEIGERGINLSGGQKQRVALARALYRDSDIYIFDEPLGAVDSTVANWIFHECLMSHLAGKTRILVTHQLQFLPFADCVIVMENGRIKHQGTYNELMASGVELSSIVKNHTERLERIRSTSAMLRKNSQEDISQEWENKIPPAQKNEEQVVQEKKKPTAKLIQDEESEVGPLGLSIFGKYFGSSGNKHLFIIVIFFYLFSQMVRVGNDYWLVLWTGNAITPNPGIFFYLGIYAIWFLVSSAFVLTRELILAYSTLNCARNLHSNMLDCMLRAPMSFFDSTPIGRIVNRFSKDQSSIDDLLSSIFADVGHCGVTVLSTVVLICVLFPLLVPGMVVIAVLYFLIQRYYRRTARELKTMDAISRSPIFSYFSESANGVNTIRAYRRQTQFHKEFMNRVDDNEQCFYWHFAVNRWLGVRLEFVSALVVLATAVFSVTSANLGALETGLAGLSLSYALSITANLNWFVRQYTEMEINMTSVQRILQYTEVKSEAPLIIENNRPDVSWPGKPLIDFKKLFVRYTQGADYVLKGITCEIQPNEKIGIVGRTGAGKSSLTATLFRLIEAASGQIDIDHVNIADIGLLDLRSKLSIIPQDPFLFHGTIRFNLDPTENHSDLEIWEALRKVNLKTIVENLPQQLDTHINENGDNFSLGQKQLFSLCRVILHKTKILILDEATASLDLETDEIIQTTVRKEFHDSTVLTIAHRLDTIIDSDRVMVLDKGELKEMDKPEALLANPDSIFSNLVSSALEATSQNKNRLEMS